jgi:hypothetical protein
MAILQQAAIKPVPTSNIEALSVLGSPGIAAKVWDIDFEH